MNQSLVRQDLLGIEDPRRLAIDLQRCLRRIDRRHQEREGYPNYENTEEATEDQKAVLERDPPVYCKIQNGLITPIASPIGSRGLI
ncbi:hypothetical protein GCM10009116_03830 [Brevundimonas basaltis]